MHSIMKSCCMLIMLAGCLVYGQMNSNRQSSRQQLIPPRPVCANIGEYVIIINILFTISFLCVEYNNSTKGDFTMSIEK